MNLLRCPTNPILSPASGSIGTNLNGPSVIRVPTWAEGTRGRYFLYFAAHHGDAIRLAAANHPAGPWTVQSDLPLHIDQLTAGGYHGHVASPDLMIDSEQRRILMFFHAPNSAWRLEDTPRLRSHSAQATGLAVSRDGLHFEPIQCPVLGLPYFRAFLHRGTVYAIAAQGRLFRADCNGIPHGQEPWIEREQPLGAGCWRHCAVEVIGDILRVYHTRVGDSPERIVWAEATLTSDWTEWKLGESHELLRPKAIWEGAQLPLRPSKRGWAPEPENALRDPFLFTDMDGSRWLYYAVAGEAGIAVAQVVG